ncbi:hypothetical protein MMC25_004924 [Agyrium rufum]|nr:hypothetical protein [Agyrium rufum]
MPWIEDNILSYFGENKASYTAKDQLSKTKITGDKNVNAIQDGVNNGVGGQFGKGGLLQPVGDGLSKEGMNRAERQEVGETPLDPVTKNAQAGGEALVNQGKGWGSTLTGGYLGGGSKEGKK